ncbi:hypothetical protein PJI16_09500 [Nitrospira sp. MA-1]|nr:hypothetical protein [Nitrospira sp. MA-1]
MIPSPTKRVWHSLGKAIVTGVVALMMVAVTYDGHIDRTLAAEEAQNSITMGTAYAQEGEGLDIGIVFDIAGAVDTLFSALYTGFDSSYIDKYYGGSVAGYLFAMLIDPDAAEFDYIDNQLEIVNQKLNHLITLDGEIITAIGKLEKELAIDTTKIQEAVEAADLVTAESAINSLSRDQLLTKYQNMSMKNITHAERSYITSTCQTLLNGSSTLGYSGNIDIWLTTIGSHMTEAGPFNVGLLQLMANQVQESLGSNSTNAYEYYQWIESMFMRYVLLQSKGLNLYVNCAHVLPVPLENSSIKSQYLNYLKNILDQFESFREVVEQTVVLGTNYAIARDAFNATNASTSDLGLIWENSTSLILQRVDFISHRVLGRSSLSSVNASPDPNAPPQGALTARVLSANDQNQTGFELDFTYSGPFVPPPLLPTIADCPSGLQMAKVWALANAGPERFIITSLAGYQGKPTPWKKHPAIANKYYGSSSYQLAVSTISLNSGEVGSVGLCVSARGAKEKDGSLYLAYHLLPPGIQTPGPTETIGWAGTGTVGTSEYTPDRFTVDEKTNTITIKGQPYNSSGTGTASQFAGLRYINWKESGDTSTIMGHNNEYRLIRYDFRNVPLGRYEVTGPKRVQLLPNQTVNVVLRDRNFNQITFVSKKKDVVMANSRTLGAWETFTFEYTGLSADKNALGYLRGANGQYVVKQGNTLIAQADAGKPIEFVGWNSTANDSKFITNWGRLAFDGNYVTIDPLTFDITFTKDSDKGTNFAITFIDKGKKALTEGSNYAVSLRYGIADDASPVTCTHLGNPRGPCFQYYLYANLGYPYGYFTYSPLATSGGFGKGLGRFGVSPFTHWENATSTWVPKIGYNNASPNAGDQTGPHIWAAITPSADSNLQYTAKAAAHRETKLQLGTNANCTYSFQLKILTIGNLGGHWDIKIKEKDKEHLKQASLALAWFRTKSDGGWIEEKKVSNSWDSALKPYSLNIDYAKSPESDKDNTATIQYSAHLSYEDVDNNVNSLYPDFPWMKIGFLDPTVALDLTEIKCPS